MPRYRATVNGPVQLSAEREALRDVEEASWEAEKSARAMDSLRTKRNTKLTESDWTQYTDSPLTDEAKAEWAVYREELRDLPESADPVDPTWPEAP